MAARLADSRSESTHFVYAKGQLSEKLLVSCTRNVHFCGASFLISRIKFSFSQRKRCFFFAHGLCPGASQASWPSAWSCQFHNHSFRARETNSFKQRHFSTSVSCTQNTHFQNQVSFRLRETPSFFGKYRLVQAKHLLWVANRAVEGADRTGIDCRCIL
mgnify:CR=1 FL=1